MPLRPCLDCGALSTGARCPGDTRARDRTITRAKREVRPYTWAEQQRRAEAVRAHRSLFGDWCPGYQRPPHPAGDLTADHPIAVAVGGDEEQDLTVLCRSCNGAKAHRGYTG